MDIAAARVLADSAEGPGAALMATFTREYERLTCPGCNRTISAYVPHFGDGTGLRVVPHNLLALRGRSVSCPAAGRIVVRERGRRRWRIDP